MPRNLDADGDYDVVTPVQPRARRAQEQGPGSRTHPPVGARGDSGASTAAGSASVSVADALAKVGNAAQALTQLQAAPQGTPLVASHQRPLALDATWIACSCSIGSVESRLGAGLKRGEGRWG